MELFIGRKNELTRLNELINRGKASLVVIKGRRRIGKSRLAEEFGKGKHFFSFSGLAPVDGVTAQDQRDAYARRLGEYFHLPLMTFTDWSDAFTYLSLHLTNEKTVILFDEISWMGSKDPTFIPKLKVWWDLAVQKFSHVVLILCGSISTWIDENIVNSTAFFGRISLYLELHELTLPQCSEFFKKLGVKGSHIDIFKLLSVVGGIPWYLEQISPHQTADENLKRLCFEKGGVLIHEFDRIFHDLFTSRGTVYKTIVETLADGMKDLTEIRTAIGYAKSGSLSDHLKALEISGFVTKHHTWSLKTGKIGRKSIYRLSDNYVRFYLRYIHPNLPKIDKQMFSEMPISSLPGWEAMMGFQLENLLLKNRLLIFKALGIHGQDVLFDNPYRQEATSRQKGCQVDYLIQMHSNTLFICEVKMRRRELGMEIIDEMKEKIARFSLPKGFGISPVLLHLGPISDSVLTSNYFYRIIDVGDFLEP